MIAMIGTSDRLCWLAETCKILLLFFFFELGAKPAQLRRAEAKGKRLWLKYFNSFLLRDRSGEGSKIPAEVLERRLEWQGKYGRSTLIVDTLEPRLHVPSSPPSVHLQLLASP